jgi:hypothetical protein
MILAEQTEGELITHRFPHASSAGIEQLLDAHRIHTGGWVRLPPGRVAATRVMTAEVYEILDSKGQPVQRSGARRVDIDAFYEGIALCCARRHFRSSRPIGFTSLLTHSIHLHLAQ